MSKHTRHSVIALACIAGLGLSACGSDSESPPTPATSLSSSPAAETPSESASGSTGTGTGTSGPNVSADAWKAAIATAEQQAGGTAYELDDQDDDGTWEVEVAVGNRSIEVTVSADGASVVGTDDSEDLDDEVRRGLAAAETTLTEGITTALDEVDGRLDDADLEEENGAFVWEVTIDERGGQDDVDVYVDVRTGDVVRVDRD